MKRYLILAGLLGTLVLTACTHRSDRDCIRVMTLNLRYDNPRDSLNAWPNRIPVLARLLEEEKPDILSMQEVLWHQYEAVDSLLKGYGSSGVGRDNGAREGEMTPVFYNKTRFSEVRTITFWLSETPDVAGSKAWGSSLPRIVTWIELADSRTHSHFYVFNTHFAHDSDSARIMSSRMLLDEVGKTAEGFPFIVTGDFNLIPYSTAYNILTGPKESVPLFRDSYFISEEKPAGPVSTFNGFSEQPGSERIDFIFVRNGMKVKDHHTISLIDRGIFVSDHWPVVSTVSLR